MNTTRRVFLKSGALALASVGLAPSLGPRFLRSTAFADGLSAVGPARKGKVLICLFQRGAVDGLSMVVPHGDPAYYQMRSTQFGGIAIPRTGTGSVIDLDGTFGLHPSLAAFKPIYDAGHLAPIQAVGSPNPSRSHFDAQDFMESGDPGNRSATSGWLTRVLDHCPEDTARREQSLRAIAMTSQLPRSFMGDKEALAVGNLGSFGVGKAAQPAISRVGRRGNRVMSVPPQETAADAATFAALYNGDTGDTLHSAGTETFEALRMLKGINPATYVPATGAKYPDGAFGDSLKQIAQLVKADVGLEVAFAEAGGWDTHANQGAAEGNLSRHLNDFGNGVAALYADLGDKMNDVVILTMSEFGRTARQNGNGGTDHGHGNCFFVMGGNVQGGKVLGNWPGLAPEQLYQNRDLAVTTDFRALFAEIAGDHLGVRHMEAVFPGYQGFTSGVHKVLKA